MDDLGVPLFLETPISFQRFKKMFGPFILPPRVMEVEKKRSLLGGSSQLVSGQ